MVVAVVVIWSVKIKISSFCHTFCVCVCTGLFLTQGKNVSTALAGHMTGAVYSDYSVCVGICCMSGLEQKRKMIKKGWLLT